MNDYEKTISVQAIAFDVIKKSAEKYEYDGEFGTYVRGIIDFENGISKAMADAEFALIKETLTIGGKE